MDTVMLDLCGEDEEGDGIAVRRRCGRAFMLARAFACGRCGAEARTACRMGRDV